MTHKQEPLKEESVKKPDYLTKPVLDTMEDYHKFLAYQQRHTVTNKSPCVVSAELFDLVTGGDTNSPLFHTANCPVIDASRKDAALKMLGGKDTLNLVIM